jgi:D-sedoheptulose 7-phosphate isomerase
MQELIISALRDAERALEFIKSPESLLFLERAAQLIIASFKQGNKLLIAGNGGSLCDAMHFGEELTGIFRKLRPALPAIALADPGHLSCIANDIGYDCVFERNIEALGKEGDIFIALTTSGNSLNLLRAISKAKERGLVTISLLGRGGGKLLGCSDLEWIVNDFTTSDRVQELHMLALHIIVELIENGLFPHVA